MKITNRIYTDELSALLFMLVLIMSVFTGNVIAGDGDVSYSAPYITVDPATGNLITVNPGPELKTHNMNMSATSTFDSVVTTPKLSDAAVTADSEQTDISVLVIALIAGGIGVLAVLANKYMKQKNTGSLS